jgi:hypothetical protein
MAWTAAGAYFGGAEGAAAANQLAPFVNDAVSRFVGRGRYSNYANCVVACATITSDAEVVRFTVYIRNGLNADQQETRIGVPNAGPGYYYWNPDIFQRKINDKTDLVCKKFRNWSTTRDRVAQFRVSYYIR